MFVFSLYVNRVIRQQRKGELRSGWVDDSPWPCIADESCLDPTVAMATRENSQGERGKKNGGKGRGFRGRTRGERAGWEERGRDTDIGCRHKERD